MGSSTRQCPVCALEAAMARTVPRLERPPLAPPRPDTPARGARVVEAADVGRVVAWTRGVRRLRQVDAAGALGVSPELLRGLERGDRGVRFGTVLDVLAGLGYDVVLVPRDPAVSLQDPA